MGRRKSLLIMADKEIEINGKVIGENSKITMSVSTLSWIIGGLLFVISTLATVGYFDIKGDVKDQKAKLEQEKVQYKEELREILKEELRYEREKREDITEDIGEIKGDIKVILEKTRNLEGNQNGGSHTPQFSTPDTSSHAPGR